MGRGVGRRGEEGGREGWRRGMSCYVVVVVGVQQDFDTLGVAVRDTQSETIKNLAHYPETTATCVAAHGCGVSVTTTTTPALRGPAHPGAEPSSAWPGARTRSPTSLGPSSRPWPPCSGPSSRGARTPTRRRTSTPYPSRWRTTRCCELANLSLPFFGSKPVAPNVHSSRWK